MPRHSLYIGALTALLTLAGPAEARMHAPYRGHRIVPAATGAIDALTQPAAAYSFRKVRSAYAGSAVKLRRATGGTLDIGFTATGDFDTTAAATFCAATSCFVDTWYDQSANARHLTQTTPANQPQYIANCIGEKPCARTTAVAQNMVTANVSPAQPLSINVVGQHAVRPGGCSFLAANYENLLSQHATLDQASLGGGGGTGMTAPSAGLAWHSYIGVAAGGGASVTRVDGAETTGGTVNASITTGQPSYFSVGAAGATCNWAEMAWWSGYALTAPERMALAENQRNYWTPLVLDTFTTPSAAYSLRKLKSTYAGSAVRLRRASDNLEADIGFLGFVPGLGSPLDVAQANAHCAATTCYFVKWYDQSGNARDASTPTPADQSVIVFNCTPSGLPCIEMIRWQNLAATATNMTPAIPVTFGGVTRCVSGKGANIAYQYSASNSFYIEDASRWLSGGNASWLGGPAALVTAWHADIGIINGASSIVRTDAAETTGSLTGSLAAGPYFPFYGADSGNCQTVESLLWNGYGLVAGERAALTTNQKNFWGF